MNRQRALVYAAVSVAAAVAAITTIGSALGFGFLSTPAPAETPSTDVAADVAQVRDQLMVQAVAEVEAQRADAQARARAEVEAWRAEALARLDQELARSAASQVVALKEIPSMPQSSDGVSVSALDDHEEEDEAVHEEEQEHEDHEHGDREWRDHEDDD